MGGKGSDGYTKILDELRALHLDKSGAYGSDTDPYLNFTVCAAATRREAYAYAIERCLEKCVRALQLHEQGRHDEVELLDIAGCAICAEDMRRGPR